MSPDRSKKEEFILSLTAFCKHIVDPRLSNGAQVQAIDKEQVSFLQMLIDAIPIPIFYKDTKGVYLLCNFSFQQYLGLPRDKVIGKTVYDIAPKNVADKSEEKDQELFSQAGVQTYESSVVYADGTLHGVMVYKEPLLNSEGKVVGLVGMYFDLTERKNIEEKLRESRAELEIRVKVRTAELTKVNEDLLKVIRERKRIEEELRLSEERFRTVADFTYDWEYWQGEDRKLIYSSHACERITGYSVTEFYDNPDLLIQIIHPEDKPVTIDVVENVWKTKDLLKIDFRIIRRDGQERWISHVCQPVYGEDNKFLGRRGSNRDITDEKKAENLLRESEARYRAIIEDQTDLVCRFARGGTLTFVNEAYCRYFGKTQEELLGRSFMPFIVDEDRNKIEENLNALNIDKQTVTHEERVLRPDGVLRWQQWTNRAIFSQEGKFIEFQAVGRDITERKEMEDALRHSEGFLSSVFSSIQDGISVLDADMNIMRVNATMEKWYTHAMPLVGKKCYEAYHCQDAPCQVCPTIKTLATGEALYEVVPKRGTAGKVVGWLDLYSYPLIDQNTGKMKGVIEYVRDISQRKIAEEALEEYRNHLEDLVKIRTAELERQIFERRNAEDDAQALRQQIEFILGATKTGLDIIDPEYNIRYIDPEWAKMYGDPIGKKCYEYFMDVKQPCPTCGISKALQTKSVVVSEEILVKENNRPIQVTTIPFQAHGGEWLVAEVNVDISEIKKAEEELKKYRDGLEEIVKERTAELKKEVAEHKKAEEVREKLNQELIKANDRLKELSLRDSHTGLYNYRYLEEAIEAEFHRSRRYVHPFSVIMMDIDYFKSINDVYGHEFGDLVLKQFAKQLKRMVRKYDIVIRCSGEEFLIIFPRIDKTQAITLGQRLLDAVNLYNFGDKKQTVKLKLSLAIASYPEDTVAKGMDLINLAYQVLSKAKDRGGNRVYSSLDVKKGKTHILEGGRKGTEIELLKGRIDKLTKRSNQSLSEAIFAFAKTIELKDHYTGEHVENTVQYATKIAQALSLPDEEVELVKQASILHDLGKIGISEKILLKKTKLTQREFNEIKRHPQIGADILRPIQFLQNLIPFIFYHHERWDGKGYPSRLKAEEIPIGARIIAIADVYQALTSVRPYRKAYSTSEAKKIIIKGSGTQFDPRIVDIFLKILQKDK